MYAGRILGIVLSFLLSHVCWSQADLNSRDVEEKSYRLYKDGNWDELIHYGNSALKPFLA